MSSPPKLSRSVSKNKLSEWNHTTTNNHKLRLIRFTDVGSIDRELLGVKGANICEMARLKLPVPPGFIINSEVTREYFNHPEKREKMFENLLHELRKAIPDLEKATKKEFNLGSTTDNSHHDRFPLLLGVRQSYPTIEKQRLSKSILNLGLNDNVAEITTKVSNNPRWTNDTYRRFIQNYGVAVLGQDMSKYEAILTRVKNERGLINDTLLDAQALKVIILEFKALAAIPRDPWKQLMNGIETAMLTHKKPTDCEDTHCPAVVIQAMVYGNIWNDHSGVGVMLSRNPINGNNECCGDYLSFCQGLDLVHCANTVPTLRNLQQRESAIFDTLTGHVRTLEAHFRAVQSVAFTIEDKELYLLNTRDPCLSSRAAVHAAVALVVEKCITEREAILRVDAQQLKTFQHLVLDPLANSDIGGSESQHSQIMGKGRGASSGLVCGRAVFSEEDARRLHRAGNGVILCTTNPCCMDYSTLKIVQGVLSVYGGITSNAVDFLRARGIPTVVGARDLQLSLERQTLTSAVGMRTVTAGDMITVDGSNGAVYRGALPGVISEPDQYFTTLLSWADRINTLHVRTEAHSVDDVRRAKQLGAAGVGCYTTEHMFAAPICADMIREIFRATQMVPPCTDCVDSVTAKLERLHSEEFLRVFQKMEGRVVKVRLLSADVYSLVPQTGLATEVAVLDDREESKEGTEGDKSENGGASIAQMLPVERAVLQHDMTTMQIRAIASAVINAKKQGVTLKVSIIVPHVASEHDLQDAITLIHSTCRSLCEKVECTAKYLNLKIGALMDTPVACVRAEQIMSVEGCDFVVFDTDRLTELMFGASCAERRNNLRVSAELSSSTRANTCQSDPFCELDIPSVGAMLHLAVKKCRGVREDAIVNIMGSHCSNKCSLRFLSHIGVDSVCVDPLLVPIAKIAAAQGKILDEESVGKHSSEETKYNSFWKLLNSTPKSLK